MEKTVVKEYTTEGGMHVKEMSDGSISASVKGRMPGTQYGTFVKILGDVTDEKLAQAKEMVVEEVCRIVREIANERDDFFIIKDLFGYKSVGHKFIIPTVDEDGFSRFKEGLIVE